MFELGVVKELNRLKWANEIYEKDLTRYVFALKEIHKLIHTIPTPVDRIKDVLNATSV